MLEYDFDQSIGYWLSLTTQAYHRAITEELAPHGVTFRQAQVLAWLTAEGDLAQAELAAKMMVEPPTLVGILDRMERDGWITRNSCPEDRRKKLIRATEAAEPVWERFTACARHIRVRAAEGITDDEMDTLKELLGRIYRNVETKQSAAVGIVT